MPIGDEAGRWVRRYHRDGRAGAARHGGAVPRLFVNARGGGRR